MVMGCYGIGVTRLLGAAIEQNHDARGIIWPRRSPFSWWSADRLHDKSEAPCARPPTALRRLVATGVDDVLLDDRDERPGVMFADWELIGVPTAWWSATAGSRTA